MKEKTLDITFHYTNEKMAIDLINYLNLDYDCSVLDAGSGKNKVWYKNINVKEKYECEIEDGNSFYDWNKEVDWIIGNPPFHEGWQFTKKALNIANIGIAFLLNNSALNSNNTPKRIQYMQEKGFYLQSMRVVADKRWFGRYYFVVYTKQKNDFLTFKRTSY
jgi:hypothetical protein